MEIKFAKQRKQKPAVEITQLGRRTYRTPELIQWGCVRDLTRAGGDVDPDAGTPPFKVSGPDFF